MAMFAPIPMPSIDNPQFKDVMDYFETLQNRKMKEQQFQQQLALQKQAEQRAQDLMPYMIQQYKDTHGKEMAEADMKKIYRDLIHSALNTPDEAQGGAKGAPPLPGQGAAGSAPEGAGQPPFAVYPGTPANPTLPDENRQRLQTFLNQNPNLPTQQKLEISKFLASPQTPTTGSGMPIPPPMPGQIPGQTPPGSSGQQAPAPGAPEVPQGATPAMAQDETAPFGQEITVKQGNPALSKIDKVAGLVPGIPKPQTHFAPNGMVVTRYPSGRVTVQRTAPPGMKTVSQETPEERQKRETATRIDVNTGTENAKVASKLETSGRELKSLVDKGMKIKKLLEENPNLTGWISGGLSTLNLSQNKKLAEFDQTTRKLQADMGRFASQRGGAQALKWAERSKPGVYKTQSYNLGMVKSILDDAKADYDEMAAEYKSRTGKDYPIQFPEIDTEGGHSSADRVTIIDSNGDEHTILRNNLDKARQRDKGLRLKEES